MRGIIILPLIVVLLTVVALSTQNDASAAPSAPVRVTLVIASCDVDGNVNGLITVKNITDGKVSYDIPVVLAQHIPPSRGGDPKFQAVPGAFTIVEVNLPGGATLGFDFGPLSTLNVDSRANSLRVEVNVSVNATLNPEKSESFPPCVRPTSTPPPEVTPIPTPPVIPTPTPAPVASSIGPIPPELTPTPEPRMPVAFPDSGGEPPTNDATRNTALAGIGIATLVLSAIAGHQALLRRR